MERVLVLGCGGSGKSAFARRLGARTGLPVVELDSVFWPAGLSRADWVARQRELVAGPRWILDGDLGPYDALEVRAAAADTAVLLNLSPPRCAWRALRRGRERWDFWSWLLTCRSRHLPKVRRALAVSGVDVVELRSPRAVRAFLGRAHVGRLDRRPPVRAIVRNYSFAMVEVTVEETVSCTADAFLELVMDPRRYAEVDRKLGRIDWVQRDGDVTEFRFRSALPGLGPGPKIVSRMTLTPGERVDVRLPDRPENRLARRFSTFEASFACVPADGGIRVTRRIAFGFAAPLRWLAEPVLRRKLRADVEAEVRGAKRLLER